MYIHILSVSLAGKITQSYTYDEVKNVIDVHAQQHIVVQTAVPPDFEFRLKQCGLKRCTLTVSLPEMIQTCSNSCGVAMCNAQLTPLLSFLRGDDLRDKGKKRMNERRGVWCFWTLSLSLSVCVCFSQEGCVLGTVIILFLERWSPVPGFPSRVR